MPLPPALIAAAAAAAHAAQANQDGVEGAAAAASGGFPSSTSGFGKKDAHLFMITSAEELKAAAEDAKKTEAFKNLASFYSWAFGSTTGEKSSNSICNLADTCLHKHYFWNDPASE